MDTAPRMSHGATPLWLFKMLVEAGDQLTTEEHQTLNTDPGDGTRNTSDWVGATGQQGQSVLCTTSLGTG